MVSARNPLSEDKGFLIIEKLTRRPSPNGSAMPEQDSNSQSIDLPSSNSDRSLAKGPWLPPEIQLLVFEEFLNLPASRIVHVIDLAVFPFILPQPDKAVVSLRRFPYRPEDFRLFSPTQPPALLQTSPLARRVAMGQDTHGIPSIQVLRENGGYYSRAFGTNDDFDSCCEPEFVPQNGSHLPQASFLDLIQMRDHMVRKRVVAKTYFNSNTDILFLNADSFFDRDPVGWGGFSPPWRNLYKHIDSDFSFSGHDLAIVRFLALEWLPELGSPEEYPKYRGLRTILGKFPNIERVYLVVGESIDRHKTQNKVLEFTKPEPKYRLVETAFAGGYRARRQFDLEADLENMKRLANKDRSSPLSPSKQFTLVQRIEIVQVKVTD